MADPASSTANKKKAPTSDRIWTVAAQLFRELGYSAATTRELAERLGVTRATLYYHVTKKEDLLYGICRESLTRVQQAVSEALARTPEPLESVKALIKAQLVSTLTDIDMHTTMLMNFDALTGTARDEILALREQYQDTVTSTIAAAQDAGALRSEISAQNLALALLNLLNWTISWYKPGGGLDPSELAELFSNVYLYGATTEASSSAS